MKKNKRIRMILIFGMWSAILLGGCTQQPEFVDVQLKDNESTEQETGIKQEPFPVEENGTASQDMQPVVVHVCGAVMQPGVYELSKGSRIAQAVDVAGGFAEDADESYVNLAELLTDGTQIYIPTKEEALVLRQESQEVGNSSGKVNINTADKALLCTLPGIGETRATDIIAYRQKNGGFSSIEDIMKVSGIKEAGFQKIKDKIVVN